ncbi:tetratricopeptide repeat protein [Striga asiatica]|uniref:Tetratricopeptide repeat protein n=1 Tax=Striga asiatica TaxID=4170 RepID=A0A5A7P343_STRAF|nr:tetratricopeptide repeat protein [Striga asiatica]
MPAYTKNTHLHTQVIPSPPTTHRLITYRLPSHRTQRMPAILTATNSSPTPPTTAKLTVKLLVDVGPPFSASKKLPPALPTTAKSLSSTVLTPLDSPNTIIDNHKFGDFIQTGNQPRFHREPYEHFI